MKLFSSIRKRKNNANAVTENNQTFGKIKFFKDHK